MAGRSAKLSPTSLYLGETGRMGYVDASIAGNTIEIHAIGAIETFFIKAGGVMNRDPLDDTRSIGQKFFDSIDEQERRRQRDLFIRESGKYHTQAYDSFTTEGTTWHTVLCPHCKKEYTTYEEGPTIHRSVAGCGQPFWVNVVREDLF